MVAAPPVCNSTKVSLLFPASPLTPPVLPLGSIWSCPKFVQKNGEKVAKKYLGSNTGEIRSWRAPLAHCSGSDPTRLSPSHHPIHKHRGPRLNTGQPRTGPNFPQISPSHHPILKHQGLEAQDLQPRYHLGQDPIFPPKSGIGRQKFLIST